jgi:hypothetical protein
LEYKGFKEFQRVPRGLEMILEIVQNSQVYRHPVPETWTEVAKFLSVSEPTLTSCRKALDRFEEPIGPDLLEELRQMVRFCEKRNRGGGGKCTRSEFIRLKSCGELHQRLETLGIIRTTIKSDEVSQ